ncbi:hypothetical protein Mapa_004140 [Marchantia paleacea]|nr:hypothetical protein Mapa_004140 [Marchantia paleacea]
MCALFFPQCEPYHGPNSDPGNQGIKTNTSGGVIYGPPNITDDIGAKYIIIKPCRALCYEVERRCTAKTKWQCDLKEGRDWSNAPYCNSVNHRDGKSMNP